MKNLKYIFYSAALLCFAAACEQEVIDNSASPCPSDDPSIFCPEADSPPCPADASAGSADFSKFVAIGTSYTAGFQAGALFTEGQNNSLGQILATQFACVGGGEFNQPSIKSEHGYNIFDYAQPSLATLCWEGLNYKAHHRNRTGSFGTVGSWKHFPNPQANPGLCILARREPCR